MDAAGFDNEQVATRDRTGQQQTVQAFLEFVRQSSLSSGAPRLRSVSCQHSPVLARHSTVEGLLTSSSVREPNEVIEPPSPILSPSAISPGSEEEGESTQDVFVRAAARQRSYSDSLPSPQSPDPATFQVRPFFS